MNYRFVLRTLTILVLLLAFLGQMTSAVTSTCSHPDANSPNWLAVRQQYDTSYVPPQVQHTSSSTVDATVPAWLAVRQQYEIGFVPLVDPTFRPIVDANSPEWLALRQQYETSYVPAQMETSEIAHSACT